MMNDCSQCGRRQPVEGTQFCIYCGAPLYAAPGANAPIHTGAPAGPPAPVGWQPAPGAWQQPPMQQFPMQQHPMQRPKKKTGVIVAIILGSLALLAVLAVLIVLAAMLFGVPGRTGITSAAMSHSVTARWDAGEPESRSEADGAGSSTAETAAETHLGVFETHPEYDAEYRPKFVLREDGSFAGIANLMEGMGYCSGAYEVDGGMVYVTVDYANFFSPGSSDPYDKGRNMGAEHGTFEIIDEDTLRLVEPETFLGDTYAGDVFTRNGESDVTEPEFEPYEPFDGQEAVATAVGGLHLREAPDVANRSITLIPEWDSVFAVGDEHVMGGSIEETWYHVEYKGQTGWANGAYLAWDRGI